MSAWEHPDWQAAERESLKPLKRAIYDPEWNAMVHKAKMALTGDALRIKLVAFDDIKLGTQRRYLVKGLIPRVGITIVWGPPKCGKSFWAFDLVMHVALDWPYRNRRVDPGAVVYCAFEGQSGIEARKEAFSQRFLSEDHDPVPFYRLTANYP
jgi:hypothetical protein